MYKNVLVIFDKNIMDVGGWVVCVMVAGMLQGLTSAGMLHAFVRVLSPLHQVAHHSLSHACHIS